MRFEIAFEDSSSHRNWHLQADHWLPLPEVGNEIVLEEEGDQGGIYKVTDRHLEVGSEYMVVNFRVERLGDTP